MEWTADVSAGDWVRERLDDGPAWGASMHGVVPRGFPAYVRVFHPASRDRPVDVPWPPLPYAAHAREWDAFHEARPEIEHEWIGWATAADAFGTTMHPLAQWHALVERFRAVPNEDGPRDATGWRYSAPAEGRLDADVLAALAARLVEHTSRPDDGFVAVWEGWGGIVGGTGYGPSRVLYAATDDPRHTDFLAHTARDAFNSVFRKPTWQPGILSDEISHGPRLELPSRSHVLFRGGIGEFTDPDWSAHVPWTDPHWQSAESPSIVWPADRAFVLVTEVDYDSTIVGGSPELAEALLADPRLEALPLPEGADLSWDGDGLNG